MDKNMVTIVKKWGNSLGLRLPAALATQVKILNGSKVNIVLKNNRIEILPLENEFSLEEMLKSVTEDNIHKEIDTGYTVGKEI